MSSSASSAKDPLTLFRIEPTSPEPPFAQLRDLVVAAIAEGRLLPGQRLPTVRGLAAHLGLATNTVAAAYRALEAARVVEGRGRAGTFVRLGDDPIEARAREITGEAAAALAELGIAKDRAQRLLGEAYESSR